MSNIEGLRAAMLRAMKDANLQLQKEKQIQYAENAADFGDLTHLDSLGVAVLLVAVEQEIEDEFGVSLSLVDDIGSLSQEDETLKSISSLTDHVSGLLAERLNGSEKSVIEPLHHERP